MKNKFLLLVLIATVYFNNLTAQSISPTPYCVADFDDQQGFPVPDAINSVSIGTLLNTTNAQFALPHYVFYNNLAIPNLISGNSYTLSVTFNVQGGAGYGVWIDYNHNNTFDTNELVSGSTATGWLTISSNTSITQTIILPTSALTGNTRMRVRIVEDDTYTAVNGAAILPCNLSTSATDVMDWGETEDYTINITATTTINELNERSNYSVYPNPATNTITISRSEKFFAPTIYIVNRLGETVLATKTNENTIDVSTLKEGLYFIKYMDGEKRVAAKFIKE